MKRNFLLTGFLAIILLAACSEDKIEPYGDSATPEDVTVLSTRSTSGGAVIKYALPSNNELLYVKAVFDQSEDIKREVSASAYVDSLVIEGLGSTNPHEVKLYAVSKTEKYSKGVSVTITPLMPPIMSVAASLSAVTDFGGFALSYTNPEESRITFNVYYDNAESQGVKLHDVLYTQRKEGVLNIRGLNNLSTKFSIYVTDRWGNLSDPFQFELTPRPEYELNGKSFRETKIVGDVDWTFYGGTWGAFFDDNFAIANFAHTNVNVPFPHSTTIDLGVPSLLSRMKMWQRLAEEDFWGHAYPRSIRVMGCPEGMDHTKPENYILMLDASNDKPSGGLYSDPNTAEDIEAAYAGQEFLFDNPDAQILVRYIRFMSTSSWSGMECSRIAEMKFWGITKDQME